MVRKVQPVTVLVYSAHRAALGEGEVYRNPRLFHAVEPGATAVRIIGNWPKIAAAYRKAGANVTTDTMVTVNLEITAEPFHVIGSLDGAVMVPDNWRALPWPELRALAAQCGAPWVINRKQAFAAIEKQEAERTGLQC